VMLPPHVEHRSASSADSAFRFVRLYHVMKKMKTRIGINTSNAKSPNSSLFDPAEPFGGDGEGDTTHGEDALENCHEAKEPPGDAAESRRGQHAAAPTPPQVTVNEIRVVGLSWSVRRVGSNAANDDRDDDDDAKEMDDA